MKYGKIFIWGPNPLNNRLLARHIHAFSGVNPSCVEDSSELTENAFRADCLFFCDCDKTDVASYCRKIHRHGFTFEESPAIALLNVMRDQNLLEEINSYAIRGVFYTCDSFELIEKGIRKMLAGEYWLSRDLLIKSLKSVREADNKLKELPSTSQLTLREREILRLIAAGLSNQSIADRLFISANTVKTHISNIYKKISAENRVQAILWATERLQFTEPTPPYEPSLFQEVLKN